MDTKRCTKCKEVQPISAYYKDLTHKDCKKTVCKTCDKKRRKQYIRTKAGFLKTTYNNMRTRVEGRCKKAVSSVGVPIVSQTLFEHWALNNPDFHYLFKEWELSNYDSTLSPSVNRIDERFGYELWNMQFVTYSECAKRAIIFRNFNIIV